jgi:hypothetical protein
LAVAPTVLVTDALLLAEFVSFCVVAIAAVSVITVPGVTAPTVTVKVKVAVAFSARVPVRVQVVAHVQPVGPVSETFVVFVGVGTVRVALVTVAGP